MITNLGRPEVPMGSAMLSKAPGTETAMGNTSNAGVSSLSNEDQMLLEEEKWNELFRNSIKFTKYEGFQVTSQKRGKLKISVNVKIPE